MYYAEKIIGNAYYLLEMLTIGGFYLHGSETYSCRGDPAQNNFTSQISD
jgi:hypothetical protein